MVTEYFFRNGLRSFWSILKKFLRTIARTILYGKKNHETAFGYFLAKWWISKHMWENLNYSTNIPSLCSNFHEESTWIFIRNFVKHSFILKPRNNKYASHYSMNYAEIFARIHTLNFWCIRVLATGILSRKINVHGAHSILATCWEISYCQNEAVPKSNLFLIVIMTTNSI